MTDTAPNGDQDRITTTAAAPCSLCQTRCGGACDIDPDAVVLLVMLIVAAVLAAVIFLV